MTWGPTEARPLPFRCRPDLRFSRLPFGQKAGWCVQDPLASRYYQLGEESFFILQQLDGHISLAEIRQRFQARFTPRRVELQQLQGLLGQLHEAGLVLSDLPEQGRRLAERRRRLTREAHWRRWLNPLAIRFRGVDPRPLLQRLAPLARLLFSPWSVLAACLWIVATACLLLLSAETLLARLPRLTEFLNLTNGLWLALTLAIVKIIHELAHGLCCRYHGGECREIGFMLLIFTPCLYCDTTDAWMIPSRQKRMAISAAGIYIELLLATTASLFWYYSEPGIWNSICLNIMVVCSVGTLFFNGNPLLRYDGYFILADWLNQPNLAEQAARRLWSGIARVMLGVRTEEVVGQEEQPAWLPLYALAAVIYRSALTISIFWFLWHAAVPYGGELGVLLLAAISCLGMIGVPLQAAVRAGRGRRPGGNVRLPRLLMTLFLSAACLAAGGLIPLPTQVRAPALLELRDAAPIFVATAGRLVQAVEEGVYVEPGTVLAQLADPELEQQLAQLRTQVAVQANHVANLERAQGRDRVGETAGLGGEIPAAKQLLADLQARLDQRQVEHQRLTLTADRAGFVLPARKKIHSAAPNELPGWEGSPLQPENRGCFLDLGTELCQIGTTSHLQATAWVPQQDYATLQLNQPVSLRFAAWPTTRHAGRVIELAEVASEQLPPELMVSTPAGGPPSSQPFDAAAQIRYRVKIELDSAPNPAVLRMPGVATIQTGSRTLAAQAYSFFCRLFRIGLVGG